MSHQIVTAMYAAITRGDIPAFVNLLDPDITWTVPGRHSLAGTFTGVPEFLEHLTEVFQRTEGKVSMDILEVVAGERFTLSVVEVRMTVRGRSVTDRQVHLFEIDGDRITSVREYHADVAAFDDLLA